MASFDWSGGVVPGVLSSGSWVGDVEEARLRCRVRLLTLAGDLDGLGLRARLGEGDAVGVVLLRVWNPEFQGPAVVVACRPGGALGRLGFWYHPGGGFVATDAEDALEPGDTVDAALDVAASLVTAAHERRAR